MTWYYPSVILWAQQKKIRRRGAATIPAGYKFSKIYRFRVCVNCDGSKCQKTKNKRRSKVSKAVYFKLLQFGNKTFEDTRDDTHKQKQSTGTETEKKTISTWECVQTCFVAWFFVNAV